MDNKELLLELSKLVAALIEIGKTECSVSLDGYTSCSCTYKARQAIINMSVEVIKEVDRYNNE